MLKPPQNRPGFILLCIAALSLAALGAAPAAATPPEVEFTCEDLEEIKAAAIQYYQEKQPERWEFLIQDLQQSAVFLKEELPQYSPPSIGVWKIEQDDGIALVRWGMDSIALRHGLNLARQDGKWIVTGHFAREEFFDPEDLEGINLE